MLGLTTSEISDPCWVSNYFRIFIFLFSVKKFLSIDLEDGEKKPEQIRTKSEKCSPEELESFVLVLLNHGARTDLNVFNRIKEIFQDEG